MMPEAQYVVLVDRGRAPRARDRGSSSGGFGAFVATVALGGIGLLIYLLLRGLGRASGTGGTGEPGRGEPVTSPPTPSPPTALPPVPPIPKDEQRLSFVMTQPTATDPTRPMSFQGLDGRSYTIDEMVARVRAGGRSDVILRIRGDVRTGSAKSAREALRQAGLELWEQLPGTSGASRVSGVSGNGRGHYGRSAA